MPTLTAAIKQEARCLGFDAVGIAKIEDPSLSQKKNGNSLQTKDTLSDRLYSSLVEWLQRGYHGTMAWMARDPQRRSDPQALLPGCRSIIAVGLNYYTDSQPNEQVGYGRIARYAWGEDYHSIMKPRLKTLEESIHHLVPDAHTRSYVDTGSLMEKPWAQEAGLGWIGKHSNLVSTEFGSWLFLGAVLTTLELDPDDPGTDMCGSCSLCVQACPTGAITEPYVVNAEKCISYLTIEFRGDEHHIPEEVRARIGNRIFGCDDCLDICPYNVNAQPTNEPTFQPSPLTLNPRLSTFISMKEDEFSSTFRRSAIRRTKYQGFLRNVKLAQRNGETKAHS